MDKENNNTVQVNTKKLQLATFAAGLLLGGRRGFPKHKRRKIKSLAAYN